MRAFALSVPARQLDVEAVGRARHVSHATRAGTHLLSSGVSSPVTIRPSRPVRREEPMDAEGLRAADEFRADLLARAQELRTAAVQQVAIARELRSLTVETRT